MRRHTIKVMVKINSVIPLLSELYNSRFLRISDNPCDSTGMLNIDEGIILVDNILKFLQM